MISETDLLWWCALNECKALTDIKSVCDLGLQELVHSRQAHYDEAIKLFVKLCGEPEVSLADCRSSADMWRRLHREIVSLDVAGNDSSLVHFDLNKDSVPRRLRGRFDFVTNVGTTEHVFNQANCFNVMHDLTKVGGIMAHAVPFVGFENHGLFKYTMKFFTRLSKANDYHCLDAWASTGADDPQFKANISEFLSDDAKAFKNVRSSDHHPIYFYHLKFNDYRSVDACMYVFLRKVTPGQFQVPIDLPDDAIYEGKHWRLIRGFPGGAAFANLVRNFRRK